MWHGANMLTYLKLILGAVTSLPKIVDALKALYQKYLDYKAQKRKNEIEKAKEKAETEENTDDLRKEIGKLL